MKLDTAELAGRCEAVARFTLMLAAQLEDRGLIDGPALCSKLRGTADSLSFPLAHREPAQRTLRELADAVDSARANRSLVGQG